MASSNPLARTALKPPANGSSSTPEAVKPYRKAWRMHQLQASKAPCSSCRAIQLDWTMPLVAAERPAPQPVAPLIEPHKNGHPDVAQTRSSPGSETRVHQTQCIRLMHLQKAPERQRAIGRDDAKLRLSPAQFAEMNSEQTLKQPCAQVWPIDTADGKTQNGGN